MRSDSIEKACVRQMVTLLENIDRNLDRIQTALLRMNAKLDPVDEPCPECGLLDAHTSNCVKLEED